MRYQKEAHKVYSLYYHVIFVVKYRQEVFLEGYILISDIKEKIIEISQAYDVEIVEIECGIDHIHLLISVKPTLNIPKWINLIKSTTSRFLRKKHADFLPNKLWGDYFWSPSYFLATIGNVSFDVLKHYIKDQRGRISHES